MKLKLDLAKKILGGLAMGDFDQIKRETETMMGLNAVESFVRSTSPKYQLQLKNFQFATEQLLINAKNKNIDGATLAYSQMTVSCVNCHKQLRAAGSK